jgi:uncharacterized membrane-anchored protein
MKICATTVGETGGDLLSMTLKVGYTVSSFTSGLIMLVAGAYRFTPISRTILFWAAFVLTRPFGATMGDLLTKPPDAGGLGFGTIGSSVVLLAILVGLLVVTAQGNRSARTAGRDSGTA